jgi:nifR3 family TIM-barrel protein
MAPVSIGGIPIETPLSLAPMAGQTNHAFRTVCRSFGGLGLVCSELLSSTAMQANLKHSSRLFDWTPDEHPVAVQLFGADPRVMAEAARIVVDHGASMVDINMGCWVPKVVKKGGGAALLNDVCSATAVVEAVVKAVDVPVTVKVRSGFTSGVITAVRFASAAEQCGARMIAVHARYADQGFTGHADWDVIRQVKQAVKDIPIFGNGDVTSTADARRMLLETGCDGVMIGRAALGNPWLFQQIAHELRTGQPAPVPTPRERAEACLWQARLTLETSKLHPRQVILELRGQLSKYIQHVPDADAIRARIVRAESLTDIESALEPLLMA